MAMAPTIRLNSQAPLSVHFRRDHHPSSSPLPLHPHSFYRPSGRNRRKSGRSVIAANVSQNLLAIWERGFRLTSSSPTRGLINPTEGLNGRGVFYSPGLHRTSPPSHHYRWSLQRQNKKRRLPSHLHPPCWMFRDLLSRKRWRFSSQLDVRNRPPMGTPGGLIILMRSYSRVKSRRVDRRWFPQEDRNHVWPSSVSARLPLRRHRRPMLFCAVASVVKAGAESGMLRACRTLFPGYVIS